MVLEVTHSCSKRALPGQAYLLRSSYATFGIKQICSALFCISSLGTIPYHVGVFRFPKCELLCLAAHTCVSPASLVYYLNSQHHPVDNEDHAQNVVFPGFAVYDA